jgi:hypothetical protein
MLLPDERTLRSKVTGLAAAGQCFIDQLPSVKADVFNTRR